MAKKCPPGVLCIENITLIFLIAIISLGMYVLIQYKKSRNTNIYHTLNQPTTMPHSGFHFNIPSNVLQNPFVPPMKDGNYFPKNTTFLDTDIFKFNTITGSFTLNQRTGLIKQILAYVY